MTVRDYVEVLVRRKWVIIITFLVVTALSIIITLMTTPMYRASTVVRVLQFSGGSGDWVTFDTKEVERLMRTYAEFATSRPLMNELTERLGLEQRPGIVVELLTGTELMQITAEALDPVVARDAANTLAEILVDESRALYLGSGKSAQ
jgi:capsular polysaccharide biosynthesis protein